jgi:hypothetical protein
MQELEDIANTETGNVLSTNDLLRQLMNQIGNIESSNKNLESKMDSNNKELKAEIKAGSINIENKIKDNKEIIVKQREEMTKIAKEMNEIREGMSVIDNNQMIMHKEINSMKMDLEQNLIKNDIKFEEIKDNYKEIKEKVESIELKNDDKIEFMELNIQEVIMRSNKVDKKINGIEEGIVHQIKLINDTNEEIKLIGNKQKCSDDILKDLQICTEQLQLNNLEQNSKLNEIKEEKGEMYRQNFITPIFATNRDELPKFYGDETSNPMVFLKNVNEIVKDMTENMKILIVKKCMLGNAQAWFDLCCGNVENFSMFKDKFIDQYWGNEQQQKIRQNLNFGKYKTGYYYNKEMYAIKKISILKYLIPKLEEADIVTNLARHYDQDIIQAVAIQGINDITSLLKLLRRMDVTEISKERGNYNRNYIENFDRKRDDRTQGERGNYNRNYRENFDRKRDDRYQGEKRFENRNYPETYNRNNVKRPRFEQNKYKEVNQVQIKTGDFNKGEYTKRVNDRENQDLNQYKLLNLREDEQERENKRKEQYKKRYEDKVNDRISDDQDF